MEIRCNQQVTKHGISRKCGAFLLDIKSGRLDPEPVSGTLEVLVTCPRCATRTTVDLLGFIRD